MDKYFIILSFCFTCFFVSGQEIIDVIPIYAEGGIQSLNMNWNDFQKDQNDRYVLFNGTFYEKDLFIDGEFYEDLEIPDSLANSSYRRNYVVRFREDHEVEDLVFLKNGITPRDFAVHKDTIYLAMWTDTLPLYVNTTDTVYFDARYEGAILVIDPEMRVDRIIRPTRARMDHIVVKDNFLYGAALIPDNQDYILLGADTVFNYMIYYPESDSYVAGNDSWALFKYNLETDAVEWHKRLGSTAEELIIDFHLDRKGDIVVSGSSSASMWFLFNDIDTLESSSGGGVQESFLGKYDGDTGTLEWGFLTPDIPADYLATMLITESNEILIQGVYYSDSINIGDTTLYDVNTENGYTSYIRGMIQKYSENGEFQWAYQLDGDSYLTNFRSIAELSGEEIIVSSFILDGQVNIQNSTYLTTPNETSNILVALDYNTGKVLRHFLNTNENHSVCPIIDVKLNGNLFVVAEARDEVNLFGEDFYDYEGKFNLIMELNRTTLTNTKDVNWNEAAEDSQGLTVFPNPSAGNQGVQILLPDDIFGKEIEIEIVQMDGRVVWKKHVYIQNNKVIIQPGISHPGSYILNVKDKHHAKSSLIFIN